MQTGKLLGHCYLFDPAWLNQSEAATRKYLAVQPKDVGALANLACVYGQRDPADAANRKALIAVLRTILAHRSAGLAREKIRNLMGPGQDFERSKDDAEFLNLLG